MNGLTELVITYHSIFHVDQFTKIEFCFFGEYKWVNITSSLLYIYNKH